MRYCMNCGEQLAPAARFCPTCGATADSEVTRLASEETRVSSPARTPLGPPTRPPQPVVPLPRPHEPPAAAPRAQMLRQEDDAERVVFTVRPTLLFIKIGYLLAALGGILLVALFAYFAPDPRLTYVSFIMALALLLIPAYYHVRRQMVRYTLTDSKIEIDEGFISQTTRNLPLRNIQDVTVKTTVFQRLCGFGDLVIDNANETGGPTVLDNIPEPRRHMDLLLRELRRWR